MSEPPAHLIKAIETIWLGYKFRSRLEARWAVFFTHMEIQFQYELQGWKLPDGTWYLPDFYLPKINSWVEVKPVDFSTDERRKCEQLAVGSGECVLLLVGVPEFKDYIGLTPVTLYNPSDRFCHEEVFRLDIYGSGAHPKWYPEEHRLYCFPGEDITEEWCSTEYRDAVYAARAARFDGSDMPPIGNEPFNVSPEDLIESVYYACLQEWKRGPK